MVLIVTLTSLYHPFKLIDHNKISIIAAVFLINDNKHLILYHNNINIIYNGNVLG